jgi:hypothetical protein
VALDFRAWRVSIISSGEECHYRNEYYDNEETDDFIPEIINDRKKKHDSSDLSLLRKKKLSYRDVMGDL